MTRRNCRAKAMRVLWCGGVALAMCAGLAAQRGRTSASPAQGARAGQPAAGSLAALVKAYRQSSTPARRAAVEAFANAHPKDQSGALARLALGVTSFQQGDYAGAAAELKSVAARLPRVADYAGYYLAASLVELKSADSVDSALAAVRASEVRSPMAGRAWIVQARTLETAQPAQAVQLLREHFSELPQPDGNLALADAYQAAADRTHAADFYQRVYYQYVAGDAASRAAAALLTLKDAMGADYPAPLGAQLLQRAGRLLDTRQYAQARSEFEAAAAATSGVERERALVREGLADSLDGKLAAACSYWSGLDVTTPEASAERLFEVEECNRHLDNESAMMGALGRLEKDYPQSPWRLRALVGAANRFLATNRPDDYVPLYRAAYENFPTDPEAGLYHWRVTFQAYLHNKPEALEMLREHLRNYGSHPSTGTALYFLGRYEERNGDWASARACYRKLAGAYENHYYSMLARQRLAVPEVARATGDSALDPTLAEVKLAPAAPVAATASRATTARIERSRMLRSAGLGDLADAELRFGARDGGQSALLGMEIAAAAESQHQALHTMKAMAPEYLNLNMDGAPRKFWELLFPMPYRAELERFARARGMDPFLLAGLIRQESEFDPQALSPAKAYGLTQVLPVTGRQYARKAGIPRFTTRVLFQPTANLSIGTLALRSMLDANGGRWEQTLAAYNAGPARAAVWSAWNDYREPAEFVESIPYNETREYVQAVLRNADVYRRLYGGSR